jgi:hypothetical protein
LFYLEQYNPMKKTISLLLLVAFLNLLVSCNSQRIITDGRQIENQSLNTHLRILSVNTKDGTIYNFNERYPGRIIDSRITGTPQVFWNFSSADSIGFSNDREDQKFLWKDGTKYQIIDKDKTRFICITTDNVNISFDTIAQINYQEHNKTKTTFLIVGTITGLLIIMTLILWQLTYDYVTQ